MSNANRQKGAALIVSLVLVVVALLLSLSGMQGARLEQSMSANYRASERALMAAEYGAAQVVDAIVNAEPMDNPLADIEKNVFCDGGGCPVKGQWSKVEDGIYFQIAPQGAVGFTTKWLAIGAVFSGNLIKQDTGGFDNADGAAELVAKREIEFHLRLDGLGKLSAQNPVCTERYSKSSQASEIEGETEVDGQYNPAVSAGSREAARKIVAGIIYQKNDVDDEIKTIDDHKDVTFVPFAGEGEDGDGTYHASLAVDEDGTTIDYGNCKKSNRMCNYLGGVSTQYGASILADSLAFHNFISAIFRDSGRDREGAPGEINVNFTSFEDQDYVDGMVNIYTDRKHYFLSENLGLKSETVETLHAPLIFDEENKVVEGGDYSASVEGAAYDGLVYEILESNVMDNPDSLLDPGLFRAAKYAGDASYQVDGLEATRSTLSEYFPTAQSYYQVSHGDEIFSCSNDDGCTVKERDYKFLQDDAEGLVTENDAVGDASDHSGVERAALGKHPRGGVDGPEDDKRYSGKSGLLIIDGHATFNADPEFEGMIIVLGDLKISGGGRDNFNGAIIAAPYFYGSDDEKGWGFHCQEVIFDADGGGNHDYLHDQVAIDAALNLLPDEAWDAWIVGNKADPHGYLLEGWFEKVSNN